MEITELISFYVNENTKSLEVTFRTTLDSDEELREDKINFNKISEFGYDFIDLSEGFQTLIEEDDYNYDDLDDGEIYIDESEVISFLNEYYSIYPETLPKSDFF